MHTILWYKILVFTYEGHAKHTMVDIVVKLCYFEVQDFAKTLNFPQVSIDNKAMDNFRRGLHSFLLLTPKCTNCIKQILMLELINTDI